MKGPLPKRKLVYSTEICRIQSTPPMQPSEAVCLPHYPTSYAFRYLKPQVITCRCIKVVPKCLRRLSPKVCTSIFLFETTPLLRRSLSAVVRLGSLRAGSLMCLHVALARCGAATIVPTEVLRRRPFLFRDVARQVALLILVTPVPTEIFPTRTPIAAHVEVTTWRC